MRNQRGRIWLFVSVAVPTALIMCCCGVPLVVVLNFDYFFATAIRMSVEASDDGEPVTGTPGEELRRLDGHRGDVYCVAYSPDGRRILSASGIGDVHGGGWDCSVRLWDAETGREIRR